MYKRIILKLSGETLAPEKFSPADASHSFEAGRVDRAAKAIVALADLGVQVGVVMGGGNIWRGRFTAEMNPVLADQMGMLATIINALCCTAPTAPLRRWSAATSCCWRAAAAIPSSPPTPPRR